MVGSVEVSVGLLFLFLNFKRNRKICIWVIENLYIYENILFAFVSMKLIFINIIFLLIHIL